MSIIINALKKADKRRKQGKRNEARKFLFGYPHIPGKHRGFWIGLLTGFVVMLVFLVGGLAYLLFFIPPSQQSQVSVKQPVLQQKTVPGISEPILDIDKELAKEDHIGLDIEDELYLEELLEEPPSGSEQKQDEKRHPAVVGAKSKTNSPSALSGVPMAQTQGMGLPDLVISGVVWDMTKRYVFINGVPYNEKQKCGDVLIKKIALSYIVLEYENQEYEVVLQ